MEQIRRFFAPPVFPNPYDSRRAVIINTILLVVIMGTALLLVGTLVNGQQNPAQVLAVLLAAGIGLWVIFKRGNLLIPGIAFPLVLLVGIAYLSWNGYGLHDEVMMAYPIVIVLGSFMLRGKSPFWFTLAVILAITWVGVAEITGQLVTIFSDRTDVFDIFVINIFMGITGALVYILVSNLTQSLNLALENEQNTLLSNRELDAIRRNLEMRVAERTRDLTLSAEIGRTVAQERNLEILLSQAVERIQDSFSLYYVQIYLADAAAHTLILQAGSGAVGQELLRRGYRLPINTHSINGSAAANRQAVLVEDTRTNPSFLPNPLLPLTHSEMSIPLIAGSTLLGVLNMQSEQANTFTQETLPAFEILAGQLASAITTARQFADIEQSRAQLEAQARLLTRSGWDNYLDAIQQPEFLGVAYENGKANPLTSPAIATVGGLTVPIPVAGEEIGQIHLVGASNEAHDLIQRVAVLAGQQIENLRLFAQAEQYRHQAELAVRRLTREGWDAYQETTDHQTDGFVYAQNQVQPYNQITPVDQQDSTYVHSLSIRGEPIGSFNLLGLDEIDEETTNLVTAVAEALTDHIENLRLAQATQNALSQTATLYGLSAQLTRATTLEDVIHVISTLYDKSNGTLATIEIDADGRPEWLTIVASVSATPSAISLGTRFPVSLFPVSDLWVNSPDHPVFIEDIANDPRVDPQTRAINEQFGVLASVYLPLHIGNSWIGLAILSWSEPRTFSEADKQLFEAISSQAAVVVNNQLLLQATTKRANRESLINTINQRIQGATSVETALEIAAREVGQLLKVRQAIVELGISATNGHS